MVAKITVPLTIKRALNYNENKLREGTAECIYAGNFLKEAHRLNFYEKLKRFEDVIVLNQRAATNTVHISLNFGPDEQLEREKLKEIATVYMQKIGFGEQPYLVYQHHDAGHPHVHIVTTNIQQNGKRISLHNLGRNESAKARKEIETMYKLVKAEDQRKHTIEIKPIKVQRILYGKSPTKRAISHVLNEVIPNYKYTSLAELNAVLRLYNLVADRGKENGIMYKNKGLVYRVLDDKGTRVGVPIKASSLYRKPTLSFLEQEFKKNEPAKQAHKKPLKTAIDWILLKPQSGLPAFRLALQKEKISLLVRQNNQGVVYGLTYIDHNTKCVFNGSDIGKPYSANAILQKCSLTNTGTWPSDPVGQNPWVDKLPKEKSGLGENTKDGAGNLLDGVIAPKEEGAPLPYGLKRRKKKRKRNQ